MELLKYLNDHFLTKQQLLEVSKVSEPELLKFQQKGVMPKASYKLSVALSSESFFGLHDEAHQIEYYAKGYASWLGIIQSHESKEQVYAIFSKRYEAVINFLKQQGHSSRDPKINSELHCHIEQEWTHFIAGIYGLCTKTGLPEDIAAKEFAVFEINELSSGEELTDAERRKLAKAVDLLDEASSFFAPHERLKSSRHKLINSVRRQYKL